MYVCLHSCLWNSVLEIQKLCKALQVQVCFPPQSSATQLSSLEAVTVISFLISQKYFSHVETSKHTYSFFAFYKVMAAHYTFCSSVQPLSHVWLCEPVDCTTPGLPGVGPSPSRGVYPDSCPLSWWCHPTISSSVVPSSWPQFSQHQGLFKWVSSSHQVAEVLELQLQDQSFPVNI